jgi:DNA primase
MSDSTTQEIKDRLDIAEVISGYMQLKKAGTNFKGLCPFHNEKSPSFVVTPSRQIWHCFGCGEGGDVFSFVQKFENLDFVQTLKLLADRAGVKLPEYRPGTNLQEDEKEMLVRINTFAAKYYYEILIHPALGKEAREYLLGRGLSRQTIEGWQIGFAPNDFHSLSQALKLKKVTSDQAIKAGVVVKNEKGNIYDRFRGRITFPIFNYVGEVVGFSARILPKLDDGKTGKYINSPETLIYNKSRVLFGLNFAKNHIRKKDEVIVVEGQMDCISAHQAGFLNTVASSGTAITAEHLSVLGRLTKNIKFCLDADSAGLLATRRAVEHLLGKDFTIKIVSIKGAKDPDELIKKDRKAWEKAVKEAPLFLDYYIERLFGEIKGLTIETKKTLRNELLPLIKKLNDALEQEHYLKLLAKKLDATPGSLLEDMNKLNPGYKKPAGQKADAQGETALNKAILQTEKLVLGGMLSEQTFLNKVIKEGEISDFSSAEIQELALNLFSGTPMSQNQSNLVLAKEAAFMVELLKQESPSIEAFTKDLTNAFFALRGRTLRQKQQELQAQIKAAEEKKDEQKLMELQKEFMEVAKKIVKYKI